MQVAKHTLPMQAYRPAVDRDDAFRILQEMYAQATSKTVACEVVLDGIRCDIRYTGGVLVTATAYTNNPEYGVDVSELAKQITLANIDMPYDLLVRGTLVLPIELLCNESRYYTNPASTQQCMREAMDPKHPHHLKIEWVVMDYINFSPWMTKRPLMYDLSRIFRMTGGCRNDLHRGLHTDDLKNMLSRINAVRTTNRYDTAGYVFKIGMVTSEMDGEYLSNAVYVEERRRTEVYTVVGYENRVMKSGKIVPWATLRDEGGNVITTNLVNHENAMRCFSRLGDKVLVDSVGFATPYIRGQYDRCGTEVVEFTASACPVCAAALEVSEGANPMCANAECTGRKLGLIKYILSKPMMGVIVPNEGYYHTILASIDHIKQPVATGIFNITASKLPLEIHERIQAHRVMPLHKAFMLLDVPNITMVGAKNLTNQRGTLKNVFLTLESVRSERDYDILSRWWTQPDNQRLVNALDALLAYGHPAARRFSKHVCISGLFDEARANIIAKLQRRGYGYHVSPNSGTDYILVGRRVGDVWEAVKRNNIQVVRELKALPDLTKE